MYGERDSLQEAIILSVYAFIQGLNVVINTVLLFSPALLLLKNKSKILATK